MSNSDVNVFGVRHLSPAGAWHVRAFLEELRPSIVLVEGPSDASNLLADLFDPRTKPPVAILAFTQTIPVRMVIYPFAEYSPEYEAFRWAKKAGVPAAFIDLPTSVSLARDAESDPAHEAQEEIDVFQAWADLAGEPDYDTAWERLFELGTDMKAYHDAGFELGASLRGLDKTSASEKTRNKTREAWMRKSISEAVASGHEPAKIAVICGAFHASALGPTPEIDDASLLAGLPSVEVRLTLMPYSYYRLSSQSGYGAGNRAPAYFDLLWDCLRSGKLSEMPVRYFSRLVARLRENGQIKSTAQVIEATRLAQAMSSLYSGKPTLRELKDAAITCLGEGTVSPLLEAMAWVEVGPRIGSLPEGISRTALQDDFYRELDALHLSEYRSPVARGLDLDLRKNLRVKSEDSAYLDLRRSRFLHRLRVLGIPFAIFQDLRSDANEWKERWNLAWTPEAEMALIETNLKGETLEVGLAFEFRGRLDLAATIPEFSIILHEAAVCNLTVAMESAETRLQNLASDSESFNELAGAAQGLALTIRFGGVRNYRTQELESLIQQISYRACHLLTDAARCSDDACGVLLESIDKINRVVLDLTAIVQDGPWIAELRNLAAHDDCNPRASGYACAILVERALISEIELEAELARRLSPGIEPDIGAGWFEGLATRNSWALISRLDLWRHLDEYLDSLEDGQFARALVYLRRTFSMLSVQEKRGICENLAELWKTDADVVANIIQAPMDSGTKEKIEALNDFDFEDL